MDARLTTGRCPMVPSARQTLKTAGPERQIPMGDSFLSIMSLTVVIGVMSLEMLK